MRDLVEARSFLLQVRAGRRGLSGDGRLAAFSYRDHTVVAFISLLGRRPLLQLGLLDDGAEWPAQLALLGIGR